VTRRTATGRLGAPRTGKRKPAHLAPRKPLLQQAVPAAVASGLTGSATSLSRIGLAAVLGSALVTATQMPAGASPGAVQAAPKTAVAPAAYVSGAPLTAGTGAVAFQSSTLTATTSPVQKSVTVPKKTTALSAAALASARRAKVITVAKRYVGVRYVWGGTKPRPGFDCSGYTKYVFKKMGRTLPRTSRQQRAHVKRISRASARKGDLVFFHSSSGRVFHVGIYAGGGKMYDSPRPGKRVGLHKIWSSRVSFGRVI
jgi:cell wall-associated NlpC family hydrolase